MSPNLRGGKGMKFVFPSRRQNPAGQQSPELIFIEESEIRQLLEVPSPMFGFRRRMVRRGLPALDKQSAE